MESNKIIYLGDCIEVMQTFTTGSIDLIITSPPYNVGIDYGHDIDDNRDFEDYYRWVRTWMAECARVLVDGGRIVINIPSMANNKQGKAQGLQTYTDRYLPIMRASGLTPREYITWVKSRAEFDESNFCGNSTAWGSWLSPGNPFCRSFSEIILVAHKGQAAKKSRMADATPDITKDEFLRFTRNVWFMPAETNRDHPAPFPEDLPYRAIKLYTWPGDVVLDPFCGSGTTLLSAAKTGRKWIGIDRNMQYVSMAKERVSRYTEQRCLF